MKIVVADDLPASALDLLRAEGWEVDARSGRAPEQLATDLSAADALVVRSATKVTAALIAAAPRLRAIARAGTGVDNVDVTAASARGIVVMNAPGANSISVAELAMGQILALARHLPAADAAMKQGKWEKKKFLGEEIRDKTLGLAGLGRIGQEVARRAAAFDMRVIAHDPFISEQVAAGLGVELVSLDDLFARAHYVSLHMPSNDKTRRIVNAERLARARKGLRIINTARGDLIDEAALADAIESGQVAGAALDVFEREPPPDQRLQKLPQVVASPHIAASTREGQELVGVETAAALRDFLKDGIIRNAVNFPSVSAEEYIRLRPYIELGERLGAFLAQMNDARAHGVGIRYYGDLAEGRNDMLANAVLVGLLTPILETGVTPVNARTIATDRGMEIVESRSTRPRNYTSLMSVKLHTSDGERWVEGAVFERTSPRLVLLDGIGIEAPLAGTMIVIRNNDQPGVIGEIGTILGRHGVNIANFALGREGRNAAGVVIVDETSPIPNAVLDDLRKVKAIREARIVRV
ncbi:MAG: phosphoglycerate dehydrogenase [Acidobacteria bacterium RIFCSPLOWO2_02_FULL_67_21]|nr:MAG: phosphoglycerate dehydrogenase [Acidobacteria bacterium RIFCSPLOWO2_02_FULL_67_21]